MQEYENSFQPINYYAKGIYIKPQLQSRLAKRFAWQAYLYANINDYKSIFGIGYGMNLFRICYKK
jgi:hypothetical protein